MLKVRPQGEGGSPKTLINKQIWKEVDAGRGTPHGGAWADLRHIDREVLKAYPWFFNRLMDNGVDPNEELVTREAVEHFSQVAKSELSELEKQVLYYYLKGASHQEISDKIGRSKKGCRQRDPADSKKNLKILIKGLDYPIRIEYHIEAVDVESKFAKRIWQHA